MCRQLVPTNPDGHHPLVMNIIIVSGIYLSASRMIVFPSGIIHSVYRLILSSGFFLGWDEKTPMEGNKQLFA